VRRAFAESGGMPGFSLYPLHIGGLGCKLETFNAMVARTAELIGVDHTGIGSDTGPRLARFHARLDARRALDLRHSQAPLVRIAGLVSQPDRFRQPDGRLVGARILEQGRRRDHGRKLIEIYGRGLPPRCRAARLSLAHHPAFTGEMRRPARARGLGNHVSGLAPEELL